MRIQITLSGNIHDMDVEQIQFVRTCRYSRCQGEFLTIDPDQLYCVPNHRIYESKIHKIIRDSRAIAAAR